MAHAPESDVYRQELERASQYAHTKVDLVLKEMLEQLFLSTPEDPIDFMISFLTEYKSRTANSNSDATSPEAPALETDQGPSPLPEGAPAAVYNRGRRRTAISAEPVRILASESHPAVVNAKTKEQETRIRDAVKSNILFSSLDREQLKLVVDAMCEKRFKAGEFLIRQGEQGDYFYILNSGEAECFVSQNGQEPKMVKEYSRGESFGELALMYNSPRAATIKAKTDVVCWAVDRVTFRKVLIETTSSNRRKYEDFLSQVKILQSLEQGERARVADALTERSYSDGEYVITQGERGDAFHIIVEGEAIVTKVLSNGTEPVTVLNLKPGDYFGELALINDNPRAANVIAVGNLVTVTLDRGAFVRLLGPIDHILKRNQDNYEAVESSIYEEQLSAVRGPGLELQEPSAPSKFAMRRRRTAVSSEPVAVMAMGGQEPRAPVIPKTAQQVNDILCAISGNFLFQGMDSNQQKYVVDSMFESKFKDGEYVIRQGEPGDNFYVLAEGLAECFVRSGDEAPVLVKTYKAGESFGELALMYNSPRAATIIAKGDIRCWAMTRVTFRRLLMDTTNEKRKLYEGFLGDVAILSSLDRSERARVADALVEKTYSDNEYVIRQNEPGDNFYIVVDGEAIATKSFEENVEPKEVMRYRRGDYFGELALLNDEPRAANVVSQGRLTVVTLDRNSFVRLLGPCDEILKRNTSNYSAVERSFGETG